MKKRKSKIIPLNSKNDAKHAKWWIGGKDPVTFAIKDKEDAWWLVEHEPSGSYVNQDPDLAPPRRRGEKNKRKKGRDQLVLIVLSSLLGVSLALNFLYYLLSF